jgi:hypothetical protein
MLPDGPTVGGEYSLLPVAMHPDHSQSRGTLNVSSLTETLIGRLAKTLLACRLGTSFHPVRHDVFLYWMSASAVQPDARSWELCDMSINIYMELVAADTALGVESQQEMNFSICILRASKPDR